MKKETDFKTKLYNKIREACPGSEIMINDAGYIQGFPDASVFLPNGKYVLLEAKREANSSKRPNQGYYVNQSPLSPNAMFVYPENEKEVLKEIKRRYNE